MKTLNFPHSFENRWPIWVAGILLLALFLRAWGLNTESAWIDEAYSIVLAQHSPSEIIRGTAADQHPPLYYLLLHAWLWFGEGVVYARWLSVLIGIIGVYQAILFGRNIGGYTLGLLSGLLVATSPIHIWYAQEVRMYILLCSLTTASTYFLWRNLQAGSRRRWIYYGVFTLLSLYTHYFSVFVFVAQGIWVLVLTLKKRQFAALIHWMISTIIVGIFFLPWLPTALYQSQAHSLEWLSSPTLSEVRDIFLRLIFGTGVQALPDWIRTILLLLVISSFAFAFIKIKKNTRLNYHFLGWISIFPFLFSAAISIYYPIFQFKQFVIILIPLLIWAGLAIKNLPRYWGLTFLGLILLSATATILYQAISPTKDDWEGATNYIQAHIQPNDVIFGNPAAISLATSIYEQKNLAPIGYPTEYNIITGGWEGEIISENIADGVLRNATVGKARLWLVEYFPEFWDPEYQIEHWLEMNGQNIEDQYFDRIRVRVYILNGDAHHEP